MYVYLCILQKTTPTTIAALYGTLSKCDAWFAVRSGGSCCPSGSWPRLCLLCIEGLCVMLKPFAVVFSNNVNHMLCEELNVGNNRTSYQITLT